jgi:hypothetical protein
MQVDNTSSRTVRGLRSRACRRPACLCVRALLVRVHDARSESRVGDQLGDNHRACPRTLADRCALADLRNGRISPGRNSAEKRKVGGRRICYRSSPGSRL